jgi:AmmeMemoRadiSam system protein A
VKEINDNLNLTGHSSIEEHDDFNVTPRQKALLIDIARNTLTHYITTRTIPEVTAMEPLLDEELGLFVTLRINPGNRLRGCIGHCFPVKKLRDALPELTISSSTQDPRFPPVSGDELENIKIEISLLSPMRRVQDWDEIRIPGHGVYIRRGYNSGVFLPQVADETGWDRETFMACLCQEKAGLHPAAWKDHETEKYVFTVVKFEE